MASKEELEAMGIRKKDNNINTNNNENNKIATILRVIAILEFVSGFILGVFLGDTFRIGYYGYDFNWGLCVGIIVTGIIGGVFILGFAEVVQLLQDIKRNTIDSRNITNNDIPKL